MTGRMSDPRFLADAAGMGVDPADLDRLLDGAGDLPKLLARLAGTDVT